MNKNIQIQKFSLKVAEIFFGKIVVQITRLKIFFFLINASWLSVAQASWAQTKGEVSMGTAASTDQVKLLECVWDKINCTSFSTHVWACYFSAIIGTTEEVTFQFDSSWRSFLVIAFQAWSGCGSPPLSVLSFRSGLGDKSQGIKSSFSFTCLSNRTGVDELGQKYQSWQCG